MPVFPPPRPPISLKRVGLMDSPFDTIWWEGQFSSSQVPLPFLVSVNGHNYLEDFEFKPWKRQAFRSTTVQVTRTQADTSNEPGEQSLSTQSLWRRTQDSWHLGAGQVFLDRKNSQEFSYRSSKGVNPWVQWQLTLLNDTSSVLSSVNTNLYMAVCGTHIYLADGTALKFSSGNLSSWTTVTGTPGVNISSLCSDGHTVYAACGASGIYSTTEGAASASQYVSSTIASTAVVRFVMGRLLVGTGNLIYNVTAGGTLPSALGTSLYANMVWTDFAAGNGVIFAAGNSGNVGVIYSIQINADGTALSTPIVCAQLPNGETVNAIYGYAGSGVAIGTNLGFRFAEQALANGVAGTVALTIGPLFPLPNPVLSFSGYNRFIWGTYQNYDTTSTGLFRMDPTQFVSDLAPAYATDLMATTQGAVNSVVHFGGTPVFSVSGVGVYNQSAKYVVSGTIDSGLITYGLADPKMPVFVDDQISALPAGCTVQTLVALDGGAFTSAGTINQTAVTFAEFQTAQSLCGTMEIRQVLSSGQSNTVTPTLLRHTFRAIPSPPTPTDWTVVIQLRERCRVDDIEFPMVPSAEYLYLDGLRQQKVLNNLQIGTLPNLTATLENIDYLPEQRGSPTGEINGVCVLTFRTVV